MARKRGEEGVGGGSEERHAGERRSNDDDRIGFGYGRRDYSLNRGYNAQGPGYTEPERGVWTAQITQPGLHVGKGPRGYMRSDARIREDICEGLIEAGLDASDVEVRVEAGEVTLAGTVRDRGDKRRIEDIASAVHGARSVESQIRASVR